MNPAPIELVRAGEYRVPGSDFVILKTGHWEGPKGGERFLWEVAVARDGDLYIEGHVPACKTLREARYALAEFMATLTSPYWPF